MAATPRGYARVTDPNTGKTKLIQVGKGSNFSKAAERSPDAKRAEDIQRSRARSGNPISSEAAAEQAVAETTAKNTEQARAVASQVRPEALQQRAAFGDVVARNALAYQQQSGRPETYFERINRFDRGISKNIPNRARIVEEAAANLKTTTKTDVAASLADGGIYISSRTPGTDFSARSGEESGDTRQMFNGEQVARTYGVNGTKIIETKSGKEYADIGGGYYAEPKSYFESQAQIYRDVEKNIVAAKIERNPIIKYSSQAFRGAERAVVSGSEAMSEFYFPTAQIEKIAGRFGLKPSPNNEAAAKVLGISKPEPFFSVEGIKANAKLFSPESLAQAGRSTIKAVYFAPPGVAGAGERFSEVVMPAITITGAAVIGGLPESTAARMTRIARSRAAYQEEASGVFGLKPPSAYPNLGSILRQSPTKISSKVDTISAVSRGEAGQPDLFIANSDIITIAKSGRSVQRFVGRDISSGESFEMGKIGVSKQEGAASISRIVKSRKEPKSYLTPAQNYQVSSRNYAQKVGQNEIYFNMGGSVAKDVISGERTASASRGFTRKSFDMEGRGIADIVGNKIPGTRSREVALVEYDKVAGFGDTSVSGEVIKNLNVATAPGVKIPKSVINIGLGFGRTKTYFRKAPELFGGGGNALSGGLKMMAPSDFSYLRTASASASRSRAELQNKLVRDLIKPLAARRTPRLVRGARISKASVPSIPQGGRSFRFNVAASSFGMGIGGGTKPRGGGEIYSSVNPYFAGFSSGVLGGAKGKRGAKPGKDVSIFKKEESIFNSDIGAASGTSSKNKQGSIGASIFDSLNALDNVTAQGQKLSRGQREGQGQKSETGTTQRTGQGTRQAQAFKLATETATRQGGRSRFRPRIGGGRYRLAGLPPLFSDEKKKGYGDIAGRYSKFKLGYKPSLTARFVPAVRKAPRSVGFGIRPFVRPGRGRKKGRSFF